MSVLIPKKAKRVPKPNVCGSCTECCHDQDVLLTKSEAKSNFYLMDFEPKFEHHVLRKKKNMDCIYLDEGKCSIWHSAPQVCRTFDCRVAEIVLGLKLAADVGLPNRIIIKGREKRKETNFTKNDGMLQVIDIQNDKNYEPLFALEQELKETFL